MPIGLDTVLRKVEQMPNKVNSDLLKEFYQHMKDNDPRFGPKLGPRSWT
jgi:hypothetical protein